MGLGPEPTCSIWAALAGRQSPRNPTCLHIYSRPWIPRTIPTAHTIHSNQTDSHARYRYSWPPHVQTPNPVAGFGVCVVTSPPLHAYFRSPRPLLLVASGHSNPTPLSHPSSALSSIALLITNPLSNSSTSLRSIRVHDSANVGVAIESQCRHSLMCHLYCAD